MKTAPSSAAMNAPTRSEDVSAAASAVPTSTGATPAGSVRGRAASSQILIGEGRCEIASGDSLMEAHALRGNCEKSGRRLSL